MLLPKLVLLKINNACWSALGGAVLSCQTAGAPLRNPESILAEPQRLCGVRSGFEVFALRQASLEHGLVELCRWPTIRLS